MNKTFSVAKLSVLTVLLAWLPLCAFGDKFPEIHNSEHDKNAKPMSAEEAAAGIELPDGFKATVFAKEPDVQNPIAMAWDDKGRMWVAENFTYADRTERFDLSMNDRVLIFEDADNDGHAESRKVFVDNVQMLTSIEHGRGGIWLMCPPKLLFIPDANGDDIPDGPAQVVLDGFTVSKQNYHNFANGLRWGPDGWLYGRCGHSCPGNIGLPGTPKEKRLPMEGGFWRYHPERKTVEVLCHGTVNPWGHDWDKNGELFFINTVIGHLWHMMPGAHFKESFGESMNPHVYSRLDMIADHYHYDTSGSWTASRDGAANSLGGGHAHVGMMIYQGDHWPQKYRDKLYTINMHGKRVNCESLKRKGAGFTASHNPDLFLTKDPFFRGTEIQVGPDGNVYLVDWSDTGECHEHTGVHRTSGRIFKISYGENSKPKPFAKPLCLAGDGVLPTLWKDYQAGKVTTEQLRKFLVHPNENVRVWAIRLLTDFWPIDTMLGPHADAIYPKDDQSIKAFIKMARDDQSGLVHLTLASTLQRMPIPNRAELAMELVKHKSYANDRDLPSLIWYGLIPVGRQKPNELLEIAKVCQLPTTLKWITRNLATQIESNPNSINGLLVSACGMPTHFQDQVLMGLQDAFKGWRKAPQPEAWSQFAMTPSAKNHPDAVRELGSLFGDGLALDQIRKIVKNGKLNIKTRQTALKTLIKAKPDDLRSFCESLLGIKVLNATAAEGLALFDDKEVGKKLIYTYRRADKADRPRILEILVSRKNFAEQLVYRIGDEKGQFAPADISPFLARQIRGLNDEGLTKKLTEVWGEMRDSPKERKEMIAKLKQQITPESALKADLSNGRALFKKSCSTCHKLYNDGAKIGPNLTGSQRSNLDYLLENILDPSAVVGKDYRMSIVVLVDGRSLNGLVVSKDEKKLVIQTQTDLKTIAADDVLTIKVTTLSPMPDGLLNNLTPDQVRDLFAYLMHPNQVQLPKE